LSGFLLVSPNYLQAGHLPTKSYTAFDGLANDSVNKIIRDSRGFCGSARVKVIAF
jgi:hypothetical protein